MMTDDAMLVVELLGLPPEALGRTPVVLDERFERTRCDKDSFARFVSRRSRLVRRECGSG
jgi:hypothetical protein